MSSDKDIKRIIHHDLSEFERFSSMLSKTVHDVNNPLAVFIGQLSIIELLRERDNLTPEKFDKVLSKFKSSTETFKSRLELLRNFYKVPVNDPSFTKLEQILSCVTYYFENQAFKAGLTLTMHIDFDGEVDIDAKNLFLVVKNLVQNSLEALIEYNTGGGLVDIKCEIIQKTIKLTVSDDGPGLICPLDLACELGYTTKTMEHSGFGLSIISQILKERKLNLEYKKTDKTEFSVIFPIK